MNSSILKCRVRKTGEGYEGTIYVCGLKPTKLIKKDETSVYANVSGVRAAARAMADRFGMTLEVDAPAAQTTKKVQVTDCCTEY